MNSSSLCYHKESLLTLPNTRKASFSSFKEVASNLHVSGLMVQLAKMTDGPTDLPISYLGGRLGSWLDGNTAKTELMLTNALKHSRHKVTFLFVY